MPRRAVSGWTQSVKQPRLFSRTARAATRQPRFTLSRVWAPTGAVTAAEGESGFEKLIRAGFIRQSQPGIFQLLPFGVRVQDKIEKLVDKHMQSIVVPKGASRVELSTITSEELWRKSGRLDAVASELFRFTDRKDTPLMLSPTHEEEITTLVASTLTSYKTLPLRLYQITRKYRDELRPRQGLLRSREFLMKDLYTFDISKESALETYRDVSGAYQAIFADLKLPVLVAEASSGDMGGNYSHEYHLPDASGEDTVAACGQCGYIANDEVAETRKPPPLDIDTSDVEAASSYFNYRRFVSKDRKTLINAWYPRLSSQTAGGNLNIHAVKAVLPDLDATVGNSASSWKGIMHSDDTTTDPLRLVNIVDSRLAPSFTALQNTLPVLPDGFDHANTIQTTISESESGKGLDLLQVEDGDACPKCEAGELRKHRALELGHTFHLGTRYSKPLGAAVIAPSSPKPPEPVQMGCYGIGISRIFGAVAEHMADSRGLVWPRAIAPFEVVIIPTSSSGVTQEVLDLYDALSSPTSRSSGLEVVLDDRKQRFGWKVRDADTMGYPILVILGKAWRENGVCELVDTSAHLAVNLESLDAQQLSQVKKQLDEELEHLTSSFAQLHGAQNKFRECLRCVQSRSAAPADATSVLVPLTNSLYVRGDLTDTNKVLVDVGTGFLVEKVGMAGADRSLRHQSSEADGTAL
ncbi:hypothetical protein S7711_02383 [Stachybotrys chartarum IBT 7711]|uniref:proline--tRNA ligase n=1 Tax=Stachybotrys chartarum (strain CBS 109288 / IBT 7711) TaxID=1280523 RepID=A0A084AQ84_STACB|nr:hypothetical protein S7711_02383 [Stachybotrys chartarum IBT 7711]